MLRIFSSDFTIWLSVSTIISTTSRCSIITY
nr:MAG TPA: hypothetical protein [Caudoviricetes sp.]